MEYWDLYNKDRKKTKKTIIRGSKLKNNEYHLVINAWIKNEKNEFLITRRSPNKSHPLMWETTGGSALKGENSLKAACREIKEELGIEINPKESKFIGSTLRYYEGCPDILDCWVFESICSLDEIKIQKEEVCDVKWASIKEIRALISNGKFEANAMIEKVFNIVEKKEYYYVGFNGNNAICNENFFTGSITLYPNNEKGNIYFSKEIINRKDDIRFLDKYQKFICSKVNKIIKRNEQAYFICFNKKIRELLKPISCNNIIYNSNELIESLNDKYKTRKLLKGDIPLLNYTWYNEKNISYDELKEKYDTNKFVIQGNMGAGGESSYLIKNQSDIDKIDKKNDLYCVSKYEKNLPLNITIIIGEYDILYFPISVQLISLINNKFKYVGADFIYPKNIDKKIINKIKNYSNSICNKLKDMGYRGIVGIDYILNEKNELYFMEINPRFQASSFLISKYLEKYCSTSIAELHYLAITKKVMGNNYLENIEYSFLNCNSNEKFDKYNEEKSIFNGYCEKNKSSYYRKLFKNSIIDNNEFESLD